MASTNHRAQFTPTKEQIVAARRVLMAMAVESTVKPIVEAYAKRILEEASYPYAACWSTGENARVGDIKDPKLAFLMDEATFLRYSDACSAARDAAGLKVAIPGNCPLVEAEHDRLKAERLLLDSMKPVIGYGADFFAGAIDSWKRACEITLQLLAPHLGPYSNAWLAETIPSASPDDSQHDAEPFAAPTGA